MCVAVPPMEDTAGSAGGGGASGVGVIGPSVRSLVDTCKQVLAHIRALVKLCKHYDKDQENFLATTRLAAQLIAGIEECVKRIQLEAGSSPKEQEKIQILDESAQNVKTSMVSLIKLTKNTQETNFDEQVRSQIISLMSAGQCTVPSDVVLSEKHDRCSRRHRKAGEIDHETGKTATKFLP